MGWFECILFGLALHLLIPNERRMKRDIKEEVKEELKQEAKIAAMSKHEFSADYRHLID